MRRLLLTLCTLALSVHTVHAQTLMDYVDEVRGDTLVIKNLADMNFVPNSVVEAIALDETPPPGRVYMLKAGTNTDPSEYPQDVQRTLPDRPIQIVGEFCGLMVQGTDPTCRPPLISGYLDINGNAVTSALMDVQNNITFKNLVMSPSAPDGNVGFYWTEIKSSDGLPLRVTLENVMGEHSSWTFVQSNLGTDASIFISNSLFINATDLATRRNGGVYDSVNFPLDTLWVENSSHVQNSGMQYKFRNHAADKVVMNHNTFVNAAGHLFLSFGYETNFAVTNNLFVNSNYQPYYPGLDGSETDQDLLPHGIINLSALPGGRVNGEPFSAADRKVLVDLNGVYWDSRLTGIAASLNANGIEGSVCSGDGCEAAGDWQSQTILANARTQQIFNDDTTYPLITQGEWLEDGSPGFSFLPDMMDSLVEWGYNSAFTGSNNVKLQKIRSPGNPADGNDGANYFTFDWPVYVDLSYSNASYLDGGLSGYPLGDLNWFPSEKMAWMGQRTAEYGAIEAALAAGNPLPTAGEETPSSIRRLEQNAPNPTSGRSSIGFELVAPSDVRLTVYDALGREVAVLVDGVLPSGPHTVDWTPSSALSGGVYVYTLVADGTRESRRLVLVR